MDNENPHRTETKCSQRIHWKGGRACGVNDDPDRIELTPRNNTWPALDFAMPRQRHELERVEKLMARAYERGQSDAKSAMGKLFKEIIGL